MITKHGLKIALLGLIAVGLLSSPAPGQITKMKPSTRMALPRAELSISHFGEPIRPGTMRATLPGSSPPPVPTYSITAGETFTFAWSFSTKNAVSATAKIIGGGHQTTVNPGTPTDASGGWKVYRNQRNMRINEAGVYTLRVVAVSGGGNAVKEKSIRFEVSSAELQCIRPVLNAEDMTLTFKVKNVGNATASGRFKVYYQVQGRSPLRQLLQSNFTTDPMELRRNRTAVLGNITLPESAWQSAQIWTRVTINLVGPVSLTTGQHDYTSNWPTKTLTINNTLLSIVGSGMTGHVLVHNYTNPSSTKVKHLPYQQNASEIALMGDPDKFNFDRLKYEVGYSYYFFVRNFRAELGGRDFLTVENGKLCLNIVFDCSQDREVKGWKRRPVMKDYSDDGCPDLNIQRFKLKVKVEPRLRGNKVSYRNPQVSVDSAMRIPGGWAFLNGFKDRINREVKNSVGDKFERMLNGSDMRTMLENRLTQAVMDMGGLLGIHDLISIRGSGDEIIVTYR